MRKRNASVTAKTMAKLGRSIWLSFTVMLLTMVTGCTDLVIATDEPGDRGNVSDVISMDLEDLTQYSSYEVPEYEETDNKGTGESIQDAGFEEKDLVPTDDMDSNSAKEKEDVIPIEKVVFDADEFDVVTGSTFDLVYSIIPKNANYRDLRVEISNELLECKDNMSFYSNEAGDSEISVYQDDRLLGTCKVHSALIDIENIVINGGEDANVYIGDSVDVAFEISPESATNRGIIVESSDSGIADVTFDEQGKSSLRISGKNKGNAIISVITPKGDSYSLNVSVNDVEPTEISLAATRTAQRIEVGDAISFDVVWNPENTSVKELTWTSNNSKVVKVDKDGKLVAVGVGTAELTAKHKSGISTTATVTVEPTLVTKIVLSTNKDVSKDFYIGNKFTILAEISPANATDQSLTFTSSNESVVKVSKRGEVTATGVGSATITVSSADGPKQTMSVTVSPSPQKFKITWSASLYSNDHVGSDWKKSFLVDGERFNSGSTIVLNPDSSLTVEFDVEENDTRPDVGSYYEKIVYSNDLCKNGHSISTTVKVVENGGRYSGNAALWNLSIKITPVK